MNASTRRPCTLRLLFAASLTALSLLALSPLALSPFALSPFALSPFAAPLLAQSRPGTGTFSVSVLDDRSSLPLPYAVVSLAGESGEQFTDSRGQLTLLSVAPGGYRMTIRRIGFAPITQQVTAIADSVVRLSVRMHRLPQVLRSLRVSTMRACATPGRPGNAEPELEALVNLVQENAARHRLLAQQYPFTSYMRRLNGDLRESALYVVRLENLVISSSTKAEYRAGRVIRGGRNNYTMALPSVLDLAGDEFARAHCFFFGGVSTDSSERGQETWLRLDVVPADALNSPDVHGSFYIDSATASLRKMELSLTRVDKLPSQVSRIADLRVVSRFMEIADGLSVLSDVCAVTSLLLPVKNSNPVPAEAQPVELQKITGYLFHKAPPDMTVNRGYDVPPWQPETFMSPSAVWCRTP